MSSLGGFGVPGHGALVETSDREILWGGDHAKGLVLRKSAIISGAARDAGNSPTTVLRRGLLLGKVDATGEMEEWDADASDGTQNIAGILNVELRATDFDANNADRAFGVVIRAPLLANQLLIQGTALTSHIDEFLARRQLVAAGCILDDDPFGYLAGQGSRVARVTGTTDTLTEDENGTTLFYSNAASVTVTLPTIKPGLEYEIVREGDEELVIASALGGDVIVGNDLAANGVTITTAGEHIGARFRVRSIYMGTTLKWLIEGPLTLFGTGTATLTYGINT